MANKKIKKLNTDLDDSLGMVKAPIDDLGDEELLGDDGFTVMSDAGDADEEEAADNVIYKMGDIVVDDPSVVSEINEDQQILQSAVKKSEESDDEDANSVDDNGVWIDDEAFVDDDQFLEAEDFDPDEDPYDE